MANTPTQAVEATVAQIKRCADAGLEVAWLAVEGLSEARACQRIRHRLLQDGYSTPLVADLRFEPQIAEEVVDFVDMVHVNPTHLVEEQLYFNDATNGLSEEQVGAIRSATEEALTPLVLKLKAQGKALCIGVMHGNLPERIVFQYGSSPEGMAALAMEVGEICRKLDFHNLIFSLKSANPQVMVQAYRLLARQMDIQNWDYPLHIGVTEASSGSVGRVRSSVCAGALLLDGVGDALRVSLSEEPESEAAPCLALRAAAEQAVGHGHRHGSLASTNLVSSSSSSSSAVDISSRQEGRFSRRACCWPLDIPLDMDGSLLTRVDAEELRVADVAGEAALLERLGLEPPAQHGGRDGPKRRGGSAAGLGGGAGGGGFRRGPGSTDAIVVEGEVDAPSAETLRRLLDAPVGVLCAPGEHVPDGVTLLHESRAVRERLRERLGGHAVVFTGDETPEEIWGVMRFAEPRLVLLRPRRLDQVTSVARRFFGALAAADLLRAVPVMLWFRYTSSTAGRARGKGNAGGDDAVVRGAAAFGSLLVDGLGDGVLWEDDAVAPSSLRDCSIEVLQAARKRMSKTAFISCPSCGRAFFDIPTTTASIEKRMGHLPGVRIAVVGCIVNGLGEMADADFGYVGSGPDKVDLYVGRVCARRGVPAAGAVDALEGLIREQGRWQDSSRGDIEGSEPGLSLYEPLGAQLVKEDAL